MMDAHRRMLGSRKANPIDERAVQITEAAMVQEALFLFAKDQARFIEIVNTLPEPKSRYLVERLLYDGAGRPLRILKDHYRDINNDEVRDIVLGALCLQGDHQHWSVHFAAIKDREKRRETLQKAVNLALSEDELKLLFGIACHLDALDGGHYLKAAFLHACDTVIQCESEADECWIEEDQLN
ncbi:MAG: hypothetical protein U0487_00360 [Patescibacteria group bacterium]